MIKKFIYSLKELSKDSFMNFPLTNISIFIITFLFMYGDNFKYFDDILMIMMFFSVGNYFIETKKINKLYCVGSFVIAIILWYFSSNNGSDLGYIDRVSITYFIVLFIYSMYNNYLNSKKEFSCYLENVFRGGFKLSFSYGILALSIYMILVIYNELVIDIFSYSMISDLEIFILGIYYCSNIINVFRGLNVNEGNFFKALIRKIINPLLYVSVLIIYLFIIRLFIDGDIDYDYVFYIVTYLFLFGIPIILMCSSYKENGVLDRINSYSSYLFIPLILLQVYLLFNSINLYSVNDTNYLWIMISIFEILCLIFNFRGIDYGNLYKVLMGMVIVIYIVPFINSVDLVFRSQYNNLKLYNIKNEYSDVERIRIYNAYDYFRYYEDGYLDELGITDKDIEIIKTFDENYLDYYDKYDYDSMDVSLDDDGVIDISGYDNLYNVSINEYDLNIKYIDELEIKYDNRYVLFDFYEYYNNYFIRKDNYQKLREYFSDNNILILDSGYKLIITDLYVYYCNGMITSYDMNGYLLVKEDNNNIDDVLDVR